MSQEHCLQLLFDLQCASDLLAGRTLHPEGLSPDSCIGPVLNTALELLSSPDSLLSSSDSPASVATPASTPVASLTAKGDTLNESIQALRDRLDPFDVHVRTPLLDQCRARCVQRSALLLGCFTQLRPVASTAGVSLAEQQGLVLAAAPVISRFALLPVAQRPPALSASTPAVLRPSQALVALREDAALCAYQKHEAALVGR